MSELLCVHCQHPIDDKATRRGNLVICASCKGQVYVPQVQHSQTATERRTAAAQTTAQRGFKASSKPPLISSHGLGIMVIILGVILVGGAGLAVGGYFVYTAIKGHMDTRKALAVSKYQFEQPYGGAPPPVSTPHATGSGAHGSTNVAGDGIARATTSSPVLSNWNTAGNPTRSDFEKLYKSFQAYVEVSKRLDEDYKKELINSGLNRLLVADRIAADQEFKESRQIIVAARKVIEKHRKIAEDEDKAFLKDLGRLRLEGMPTEVMVERVRGVMAAAQPDVDKARGMDVAIAGHYEQAINHLESTRGTWKLEGEALVFNQNKDAERYKTFFNEVDRCAQLQIDLGQKIGTEALPRYKAAFGL